MKMVAEIDAFEKNEATMKRLKQLRTIESQMLIVNLKTVLMKKGYRN